jgi:transposase InsO family protein
VGHRSDLDSDRRGSGLVFVTVDHASTECLGSDTAWRAARVEALEPLRQGVRACFGAFAEGIAGDLKLRHKHGSQFVADDDQRELALLGIASSPAFKREPEGNGCVERFIRTLKEDLLWVQRFATIEELRLALHALQGQLQPELDPGAPRLPDPRGCQSGAARAAPGGGMNLQPGVSQLLTATD